MEKNVMAKSTKALILKCFSNLLAENDLDKITVTMLVKECNISRQTFYYHFSDIQALIDWGVKQSTLGCVNDVKHAQSMRDATVIYFRQIERNKEFLKKCFSSSLSGYMVTLIRNGIIEFCSDFYNRFIPPGYSVRSDADFIIEFIANGVTGYTLSMLFSDKEPDIEELADKMNKLIFTKLAERNF